MTMRQCPSHYLQSFVFYQLFQSVRNIKVILFIQVANVSCFHNNMTRTQKKPNRNMWRSLNNSPVLDTKLISSTPRSLGFRSTSTADYSQCWTLPPERGVKTRFRFALSLCAFHCAFVKNALYFYLCFFLWDGGIDAALYYEAPTCLTFSAQQVRSALLRFFFFKPQSSYKVHLYISLWAQI